MRRDAARLSRSAQPKQPGPAGPAEARRSGTADAASTRRGRHRVGRRGHGEAGAVARPARSAGAHDVATVAPGGRRVAICLGTAPASTLRAGPGRGPRRTQDQLQLRYSATAPLDLRTNGRTTPIHTNGHRGPAPLESAAGFMYRTLGLWTGQLGPRHPSAPADLQPYSAWDPSRGWSSNVGQPAMELFDHLIRGWPTSSSAVHTTEPMG